MPGSLCKPEHIASNTLISLGQVKPGLPRPTKTREPLKDSVSLAAEQPREKHAGLLASLRAASRRSAFCWPAAAPRRVGVGSALLAVLLGHTRSLRRLCSLLSPVSSAVCGLSPVFTSYPPITFGINVCAHPVVFVPFVMITRSLCEMNSLCSYQFIR